MSESLVLDVIEHCLVMTLNRPERRNAINVDLADRMVAALERLDDDPTLRTGVLTAEGSTFCAGMDLKDFATAGVPRSLFAFVRRGSRKPLVAAVRGQAYAGGLEVALACDVIVASTSASFGIPEVRRGLLAGAGGLYRLPRRVGPGLASLMALTGDPIDARQAQRSGLVTELVDDDAVTPRAIEIAARMGSASPLAVRSAKRLMEIAEGSTSFEDYWVKQRPFMFEVGEAPDSREGAAAFVEKREPRWATD
jgi:enoyl-CoA hydratase